MKMKNYLVFDAGGTFTKYALMDENAEILEKIRFPHQTIIQRQKRTIMQFWTVLWRNTKTALKVLPSACLVCWTTGMDIV